MTSVIQLAVWAVACGAVIGFVIFSIRKRWFPKNSDGRVLSQGRLVAESIAIAILTAVACQGLLICGFQALQYLCGPEKTGNMGGLVGGAIIVLLGTYIVTPLAAVSAGIAYFLARRNSQDTRG